MNNQTVSEGKTIAIISYITFIGTIIAFVMNQNKRNYFAAFHIRQAIGLVLLNIAFSLLMRYSSMGIVDSILGFAILGLWIYGLIGAIQGEEKKIPLLGDQFQEWFKNIG